MEEKTTTVSIARKYSITREPVEQFPAEIEKLIKQSYAETEKKHPDVNKLELLAAKYPFVPQFKNYLTNVYFKLGNDTKANRVNDELLASHPDYIFARLNKASDYLENKEFDKVPEILGRELEISALYPEKNTFHIIEVTSFLRIAFRYYLLTDNLASAELKLEELIDVNPDDPMIDGFTMELTIKEMENNISYLASEETNARNVKYVAPDIKKTTEKPSFTHEEIEYLYTQGMRIDHDIIRQILALPRETLIADLEKVISDGISRFDQYFEQEYEEPLSCFVLHAVFLLSELKATESLPVLLEIFRQSEEFFDFWFSDYSNEILWESIYHLANNKLDILSGFLKEPNRYTFARTIVSSVVLQMALHQPNRRNEVVEWYSHLFTYFLDQIDNEDIFDSYLLGIMIGDTIDFQGKELQGEIEALYNTGAVPDSISGSLEEVIAEMDEPRRDYVTLELFNIFERYNHILDTWDYYQDENDLYPDRDEMDNSVFNGDYKNIFPETYKREEPKIGRNDPCPCGSGKKYKKCCLNA